MHRRLSTRCTSKLHYDGRISADQFGEEQARITSQIEDHEQEALRASSSASCLAHLASSLLTVGRKRSRSSTWSRRSPQALHGFSMRRNISTHTTTIGNEWIQHFDSVEARGARQEFEDPRRLQERILVGTPIRSGDSNSDTTMAAVGLSRSPTVIDPLPTRPMTNDRRCLWDRCRPEMF